MITCTTLLKVDKDKVEAFENLLTRLVRHVHANEPGTTFFQMVRSRTDPLTYLVIEQYADEAALSAHSDTNYLKATVPEMLTYLSAPPALESFDPVS